MRIFACSSMGLLLLASLFVLSIEPHRTPSIYRIEKVINYKEVESAAYMMTSPNSGYWVPSTEYRIELAGGSTKTISNKPAIGDVYCIKIYRNNNRTINSIYPYSPKTCR